MVRVQEMLIILQPIVAAVAAAVQEQTQSEVPEVMEVHV
jgi:hypothetical protein